MWNLTNHNSIALYLNKSSEHHSLYLSIKLISCHLKRKFNAVQIIKAYRHNQRCINSHVLSASLGVCVCVTCVSLVLLLVLCTLKATGFRLFID